MFLIFLPDGTSIDGTRGGKFEVAG